MNMAFPVATKPIQTIDKCMRAYERPSKKFHLGDYCRVVIKKPLCAESVPVTYENAPRNCSVFISPDCNPTLKINEDIAISFTIDTSSRLINVHSTKNFNPRSRVVEMRPNGQLCLEFPGTAKVEINAIANSVDINNGVSLAVQIFKEITVEEQ